MTLICRRNAVLRLLIAGLLPTQAYAQQGAAQAARNHLIQSIPVLPWLKVGETTMSQVRPPVQELIQTYGGRLLVKEGDSPETGGMFINLATALKAGLLDEQGLQILTIYFDQSQRVQMVVFMVDRGWKDKNIPPLVSRIARRYSNLASPLYLSDQDSEATDKTILYSIGKFAIELQIPQHGSFAYVTFTTKAVLRRLRAIDGTLHIFGNHLEG